jgi:hypothetical protein
MTMPGNRAIAMPGTVRAIADDPRPMGVLCAAIVVVCLLAGRVNGAVLAAAAVPAAVALSECLLNPWSTASI